MSAPSSLEASAASSSSTHSLLAPWSGPFGGAPPFEGVTAASLAQALDAAMDHTRKAIERIAAHPEPPTFVNTIEALERATLELSRVRAIYGVHTTVLKTDEVAALERDAAPKLAALEDEIHQNAALFARVRSLYEKRETLGLSAEQARLLWLHFTELRRHGATLDAPAKKRLAEVNQELAERYTNFAQNILAEESAQMLLLDSPEKLAGLPDSFRDAAAAAAQERGHTGCWAILNTRSSIEPFLTYSSVRPLRERAWRMFVTRGDHGDEHDNAANITMILALRAERAKLLGYATHAHWTLERTMAKTPERAMALMESMWGPAVERVRNEVADMQALADAAGDQITIEPWDYRYYAEKVRKAKFDLDQNDVKPYLALESLREAMFWVAGQLFGLQFRLIEDGSVPIYHPDVRVWQVLRAGGKHLGLFYFDPFARSGKISGAWMSEYRVQSRIDGEVPVIVSNNSNFMKGKPGEPVLVSWDDARTLFHEFGHALHGLCSDVTYPSLACTNVSADFVEFPSQVLEHWLGTRPVLDQFARHVETGAPMPAELVEKIERSQKFNTGFSTVEYLSSALIDMKLHLAGSEPIDPRAFERDTLAALGMPREVAMRHRTPQFAHVFSNDFYSAGYYSYMWADTLSADAWEAFLEAPDGPYDRDLAKKMLTTALSVGNTIDPAEAYRAFRGRDPSVDALRRSRGFA